HYGAGQGVPPYNGPFLGVNLGSPFIVNSRLSLSAGRDVNYSALPTGAGANLRNTYVSSNYRAEVAFELPWRLQMRVSGGYLETRSLAPTTGDPLLRPRRDHGWVEGGALLRHFGRHLSIGGRVEHENRVSTDVEHTYDATAYGLAGEVRF